MECAPTRAISSAAVIPFCAKSVMRSAEAALTSGRRPSTAGVEESLRPTNVWTTGPRGQVTIATEEANWITASLRSQNWPK